MLTSEPRKDAQGRYRGRRHDGDVDKEDCPPAQAGQVDVDEPAAQDLSRDGPDTSGDPVPRHRPAAAGGRQEHVHAGEDLGDHYRRGEALGHAGHDEQARRPGGAAQQGGQAEQRQPAQIDPPLAVQIPQTSTGDQSGGVGEGVPAHDHLELGVTGAESLLDGRRCHIDDEEVKLSHEGGDENGRQQDSVTIFYRHHVSTISI